MQDKKTEYIVIRDSFVLGIIGDVVMFGTLLGLYYFNYHNLGNNSALNVIFTIFVTMMIVNLFNSKYKHTFYSYGEAMDYLARNADSNVPPKNPHAPDDRPSEANSTNTSPVERKS